MISSHGIFLNNAMQNHKDNLIKLTHYGEAKKMAHDSPIVRAKENQVELRRAQPKTSIRHQPPIERHLKTSKKDDIYVDTGITGTNIVESAVQIYHGAKSIFCEASKNLREWVSRDSLVNQLIANKNCASCAPVKP